MTLYVLGISAFYHDSSAALIKNGVPVFAAQEERFSRIKHDPSFPTRAIQSCLDSEGISLSDVAHVVYYENPKTKYRRVISSFCSAGIGGMSAFIEQCPEWLIWKKDLLSTVDTKLALMKRGTAPKVEGINHHRSHAASAFFPSPFSEATVLCIDGVGEWQTTTIWHGRDKELHLVNAISYPHSLGLLYSAFTYFCGFKVDSGEYKLMGLAPYGHPIYVDTIKTHLVNICADGSFAINLKFFEYIKGKKMVGKAFEKLFNKPIRQPEAPITQADCDLAASIQKVTEDIILGLAKTAIKETGVSKICLAGGVALNCVANGVLSRSTHFSDIWIQPAASDAGCALGAAMDVSVGLVGRPHLSQDVSDAMSGSLLGPGFSDQQIYNFLQSRGYVFHQFSDSELYDEVAEHLANGAIVGWFQGRMEFGPRALGSRSILGDPRDPEMQKKMNLKIKFRESFRPFAPVVLEEDAKSYFDICHDSPYMLIVSPVTSDMRCQTSNDKEKGLHSLHQVRSLLPAITHVDYSARVQMVNQQSNLPLASLLESFKKKTGCSVLVNTSFNVRGEPIVCTPEEAYICFMRTHIDILVLGSFVLKREEQPLFKESVDWRTLIEFD